MVTMRELSPPMREAINNLKHFIPRNLGLIKRAGIKFIKEFPKSEPIVSMIEFPKGRILVATTRRIYELRKNKIIPIKIKWEEKCDQKDLIPMPK